MCRMFTVLGGGVVKIIFSSNAEIKSVLTRAASLHTEARFLVSGENTDVQIDTGTETHSSLTVQ